MFSLEISLACKYFWSGRRHPFIGLISSVAVVGVAVGVAALIVVIAVMSGFERDLISRVIGTYAHMSIEGDLPFEPNAALLSEVKGSSDKVLSVAAIIQTQALLETERSHRGVLVRATSEKSERAITEVMNHLKEGAFPESGQRQVMIGAELSKLLGVRLGQTIKYYSPKHRKATPFIVSGIFKTGMYDYDANLIYIPLDVAQELLDMSGRVTHLNLKYTSPHDALKEQLNLQRKIGYPFYVRTWRDINRTLFDALKLEKSVMFIILTLIVLVACFNIIGTLALFVIDKTREIGVLKSLGVDSATIARIFATIGLFTGFLGAFFGVAAGTGICWVLKTYPIIQIPNDIYYFDRLPIDWRLGDCLLISGCALFLALFSAIYPAKMAARLNPAEALRYE